MASYCLPSPKETAGWALWPSCSRTSLLSPLVLFLGVPPPEPLSLNLFPNLYFGLTCQLGLIRNCLLSSQLQGLHDEHLITFHPHLWACAPGPGSTKINKMWALPLRGVTLAEEIDRQIDRVLVQSM
jgi:hypothetical protein